MLMTRPYMNLQFIIILLSININIYICISWSFMLKELKLSCCISLCHYGIYMFVFTWPRISASTFSIVEAR